MKPERILFFALACILSGCPLPEMGGNGQPCFESEVDRCDQGLVCRTIDELCIRPECTPADSDCGPNKYCDLDEFVCKTGNLGACDSNSDCPEHYYCDLLAHECRPEELCYSSADCPPDHWCDIIDNLCKPEPECTSNADCPVGQYCDLTVSECRDETCTPDCYGKECGPDGCGNSCPPGCSGGLICVGGQCQTSGCPEDEFEENDTRTTAALIQATGYFDLALCDEHDWYRVLLYPDTYTIGIMFTHDDGDLDLEFTDDFGNPLMSSTGVEDIEAIQYEATSTAYFCIHVYSYGDAQNTYDLGVFGSQ